MLLSERHLLGARVNTTIGCVLVGSFAAFWGLIIWNTSFGTDPLTQSFAAIVSQETAGF